jgi:GntR family transcriptional regulator
MGGALNSKVASGGPVQDGRPAEAGDGRPSRRNGIPLYYQIMRDLKEQIIAGKLAPGYQLPSEAELTKRFAVSRVVVRQALQILDDQGLIRRVKGKGSFVSEEIADDATPHISGSLEDLIHIGPDTRIRVVDFRLVKPTPDLAETFAVEPDSDLFYIQRVRLVDDRPLAVLSNHVPYEVGACLSLSELDREPLILLIEKRAGLKIDWASQMFEAVAADEEMARLLEVDLLTPLLKLTLTVYTSDARVVDLAEVYYRSDRYKHRGFLARSRETGGTFWDALSGEAAAQGAVRDGTAIVSLVDDRLEVEGAGDDLLEVNMSDT